MSIMHRPRRNDGYYDDRGMWQRTKFCFRSCGERCTCGPPGGQWYSAEHDKSKAATTPAKSSPLYPFARR